MENTLVEEAKELYDKLGIFYSDDKQKFEEIADKFVWPSFYQNYPNYYSSNTGSSNSSCYTINEMKNAKLE